MYIIFNNAANNRYSIYFYRLLYCTLLLLFLKELYTKYGLTVDTLNTFLILFFHNFLL